MEFFNLPHSTRVSKPIPKNTFDKYTNGKQKKLFSELVSRIIWLYKLSPDTVNLEGKEISEIQIIKIELKIKQEIPGILEIIDRAIPYNIIFFVQHDEYIYFSTSVKHPHPINADNSVIDWIFKSEWFLPQEESYTLDLKKSLDSVFHDFCLQLSGVSHLKEQPFENLLKYSKEVSVLKKEIAGLETTIKNCNQYNKKVELNILLQQKLSTLKSYNS